MDKKLFQYFFGVVPEEFSENIILTPFFSPKRFEAYCDEVIPFKGRLYSGAFCQKQGQRFSIIRCGIGAGIAGDCVIGLDQTIVNQIIFIGSTGGLNGATVGDIIVPVAAYDGEGFSCYHRKDIGFKDLLQSSFQVETDKVLSEKIEIKLKETTSDTNIIKKGKIFTIGSLTSEIEENLKELERFGVLGVEMELSAVLHAADKIGKSLAGVLFVSDEPLVKPLWKELEKEDRNKYNNSIDFIIRNVIDIFVTK